MSSADVMHLYYPSSNVTTVSPHTSPSQWEVIIVVYFAFASVNGISTIDPFFNPMRIVPLNKSTDLGGESAVTLKILVNAPSNL